MQTAPSFALQQALHWPARWPSLGASLVHPWCGRPKLTQPRVSIGFRGISTPSTAVSRFNAAIRWVAAKRWQMLHKVVCDVAGLGLLHSFWMRAGKNNFFEVFVYAANIGVLLGWRVVERVRKPAPMSGRSFGSRLSAQ